MYMSRIKAHAVISVGWLLAVGGARSLAEMPEGWCGMELMMAQPPCTRGACDDPVNRDPWIPSPASPLLTVTLRFNVFCENSGFGCVATQAQVDAQVVELNKAFRNLYRIEFPQPPETVFISSSRFKHFCSNPNATCRCLAGDCSPLCGEELAMKSQYADDPANKLNIYVVNVERTPPQGFQGLGQFPWCSEATSIGGGIIIDKDYFGGLQCGSGSDPCLTLGHEIGHNLGLWHSFHGFSEVPYCSQCFEIAQCNGDCTYPGCDALGDLCCDTAATPTLRPCSPPSGGDACVPPGAFWSQDEATYRNYMNYTGDGCWNQFSNQQAGRMRCWTCDTLDGWIEGGDCNNNGIADQCDLSSGTSTDCDGNGIPDDCEYPVGGCCTAGACSIEADLCCTQQGGTFIGGLNGCDDCNDNQIPDTCDIASGTEDCDFNGVPDECQFIVPKGACCFGTTCVPLMECECADQGGIWVGDGSNCRTHLQCFQFGPQQP